MELCSGCSKGDRLQRILQCNHNLCETCCKFNTWISKIDGSDEIKCPIDKHITHLSVGGIKDLPKKLYINCKNCSKEYPLTRQWWCSDCNETICSFCAMYHHRKHHCSSWQGEKLVKETFQMFNQYSNFLCKNVDKEIDEFFCNLTKELKVRLDHLNEVANFMKTMENVFGSHFLTDSGSLKQKFGRTDEKKLFILSSILSTIDKNASFDVEQIIATLNSDTIESFQIPDVHSIADLFFKNPKQDRSSNTMISIPISMERMRPKQEKEEMMKSMKTEGGITQSATIDAVITSSTLQTSSTAAIPISNSTVLVKLKPANDTKNLTSKEEDIIGSAATAILRARMNTGIPIPNSLARTKPNANSGPTISTIVKDNYVVPHSELEMSQNKPSMSTNTTNAAANAGSDVLQWVLSFRNEKFRNPFNMCCIPSIGIAVFDIFGVHLLDKNLQYKKFKGWSQHQGDVLHASVTYHTSRNSILVLNEIKTKSKKQSLSNMIIEFKLPSLKQKPFGEYPKFPFGEKRLVCATTSGQQIIFAATSMILIKNIVPSVNEDVVWQRGNHEILQPFSEILVCKNDKESAEIIYIMGICSVYVFVYTCQPPKCSMIATVNNLFSPMFIFKNIVYASNEDRNEWIPVDFHNNHQQPLPTNGKQKANILISSDYNVIYLLNCDSCVLKKGVIK